MNRKHTHGGKREGAGRKPVTEEKVNIWFRVNKKVAETAKVIIKPIIEKLNNQS